MSGTEKLLLDRGMGAPLHHQLYLVLADAIASGRYAEGDALPTEEKLAARRCEKSNFCLKGGDRREQHPPHL